MEMLILLYFAYAVYRAGLDAAVRGYALARGRDVYIGDGDRKRHYAGWTLGAALAVFGRSLWEGWRVAWPWARDQADAARTRRARRRAGDDLDDAPRVSDGTPPDPPGSGGEADWRCVRCGQRFEDLPDATPDYIPAIEIRGEGWVCLAHLSDHCVACGNPGQDSDPLVLHRGAWLHRSHLPADDPAAADPAAAEQAAADPDVEPAAGGEPAEVVDSATGEPVEAVWEDAPAASDIPVAGWAKVRDHTP
ncbi:hypothetical protein FDG2_1446 [Candidatus Protofrankia californiensis]|uniref:Uncharacterized protein n=1 Tax=Candidatus Protofrankia californiensis TaxID=1839754 RepID=A0A1C3NVM7_9ACTN|nr:hypothetical protein FDG2_1446 [Candidatus Protofrankia californiensis]